MRILVVDNHPLIREYMADLLGEAGHEVLSAEDGLQALDLMNSHQPQIAFIDLVMPNIDGETLCRIVRRIPELHDMYLAIMSGTAAEAPEQVRTCGANSYIAKGPFPSMKAHVLEVLEHAVSTGFVGVSDTIRGIDDIYSREITGELLAARRHFEVVLQTMDQGVYELTGEGRIVYTNRAGIQMSGRHEEQLLGFTLADLFEDINEIAPVVESAIRRKQPATLTGRLAERDVSLSVSPLGIGDQAAIAVVTDITEARQYEHQLREAQRMESVGTLAAGVAHDFNNLLMAIQGNVSMMLLGVKSNHPYHERLADIEKQIQSAKRMTDQLLRYARKGRHDVTVIDLNKLIADSTETFGRARREVSIVTRLAPDLANLRVDQSQIEQLLLNLFVNAGDAMPNGGEMTVTTANISSRDMGSSVYNPRPGPYVHVQVGDTGIGMDEGTQARIFEPFFTTKELGRGTGLGLASVFGTVKGHGGYIEVDSEPDRGTLFNIYLPVVDSGEIPEPVPSEEEKPTILLVDDEPAIRDVAQDMLTAMGYTVLVASDGTEALALYADHGDSVNLVVLDIVMPRMSGSEVFDRLKAIDPDVKVLLCSGYSIEKEANKLLERGADGFIQKPFNLKGLSDSVRAILA